MAGYIGSKSSVTLVDGYSEAEADAEFVNDPNDVITVSGSNVGIGTSSPDKKFVVSEGGAHGFEISPFDGSQNSTRLLNYNRSTNAYFPLEIEASQIAFETNGSERMRLDSSGNLLVGTTSVLSGGKLSVAFAGATENGIILKTTLASNGSSFAGFQNSSGTVIGSISENSNSSVAYNTSSDYRLKENVVDLIGASARVNQLNPSRFNFIADDTNTAVDGFLAHEVADVVPEAITGTKDAMKDEEYEVTPAVLDDDGNVTTEAVMGTRSVPDYQGIDQSKLVPLLTAALQEALTEIASLKTRVEALEA